MDKNRGLGLTLKDGRKVCLHRKDDTYILECRNPANSDDETTVVGFTPEAMSLFINLYAYGFADTAFEDHSALLSNLTDADAQKLQKIKTEVMELLKEAKSKTIES